MTGEGRHRIWIELPPSAPPEFVAALGGLSGQIRAMGGSYREWLTPAGMLPLDFNDRTHQQHGLRCVEQMQEFGLLNPDKKVSELSVKTRRGQLVDFGEATSFSGVNKSTLNDLDRTDSGITEISTVTELLCMTRSDLKPRGIGPKKTALLRQALEDSGMPPEFPWPFEEPDDQWFCAVMLMVSKFDALHVEVEMNVIRQLGIDITRDVPTLVQVASARLRYCSIRHGLMRELDVES